MLPEPTLDGAARAVNQSSSKAHRAIAAKKSGDWESYFWSRVNRNGPVPEHRPDLGPCWVWDALGSNGYGMHVTLPDGRSVRPYRASYEMARGPVTSDLEPDHLCRNRACVNPTHLELVDRRTNVLRGQSPCAANAFKTHCDHGHPFTPENTYVRRDNGRRQCLECRRIRDAAKAVRRTAERRAKRLREAGIGPA